MIELDILSAATAEPGAIPSSEEILLLCSQTAAAFGVHDGHVAIEFVDERRMSELNRTFRGREGATDVLSFPIDGAEPVGGGRELGDVVICLEQTADVREAVVHGVLHLLGMDHETDDGEMLELQRELLAGARS